jgi:fibronectin type 3 domain-containing protein
MRLLTLFVFAALAFGQTARTVVVTWDDLLNPAGTAYSVYRADGPCSATPAFAKIADVATKTYTDTAVVTGNRYCYTVTAVLNTLESDQSNTALAAVKPFPPGKVDGVVK